ncbi:MAG: DUF2066 domain-containing protein [Alphaproteobacteria bacterium]
MFLLFFSAVPAVQAANPLFTVENVEVDVTAKNAVAARSLAFEKAQLDAFETLAKRMLSDSEATAFQTPGVSIVSALIQDFEISNEQLSSVRYKASYKFRFKDMAVKQFFSRSNVDYTDISARPALVLPFYNYNGRLELWSPYNAFLAAWNRADNLEEGLVPLIVPLGDVADVSDIGDASALNYQERKLERILARYEASEAIIMIAKPDAALSRVQDAADAAVGGMEIELYRTDRGRPEFVQGFSIEATSRDTLASLMDRAVQKTRSELRKDWKSRTVVNTAQSNIVQARVQFASLKEWADIKKALRRLNGINDIAVKSVSPRQAMLDISFSGDERRLALALQQANFDLRATGGSALGGPSKDPMSYYSQSRGQTAPVIYDLSLRRY